MLEAFRQYFAERTLGQLSRDAFDVLVVYLIVYGALRVVRGTRAMQVGIGIVFVFVLYVVAKALQLVTVLSIMDALITSFILVLVVVFQADIRRGLMRMGSRSQSLFTLRRTQEAEMIDEVVNACTELARHRTGAIIAFERDANLDEFVGAHKGHAVDANVSHELLVALFLPEAMNKLHDGAVIIRDLRIAKAGVFFPMPEAKPLDDSFGSRHRAALGITEETDAVVVVVSEERGTISFCFNGNIIPGLDGPNLRRALDDFFSPKASKKKAPASKRRGITPTPPTAEPVIADADGDEAPTSSRGSVIEHADRDSEPPPPLRQSRTSTPGDSEPPPPLRPRADTDPPPSLRQPRPSKEGDSPPPPLRARTSSEPKDADTPPRVRVVPLAAPTRTPSSPDSSRGSTPDDDDAQSDAGRNGESQ